MQAAIVSSLASVLLLGPSLAASGASGGEAGWRTDRIRIRLVEPVADAAEARARLAPLAARENLPWLDVRAATPPAPAARLAARRSAGLDRWVTVVVGGDPLEACARWAALPEVEIAEPVPVLFPAAVPDDPLYPYQWEHDNTGANPAVPPGTPDADLDTDEAWDESTGAGILVANLEGVDWYHEDLVDNVWRNLGEDANGDGRVLVWHEGLGRWVFDPLDQNAQDDDLNGFVDDVIGWNFSDGSNGPAHGISGHGTATAGLLLATHGNGVGVAGTCPDCRLIAVNSADPGDALYAIDAGARVLSLSFVSLYSAFWEDVISYAEAAGTVIVASAGNTAEPAVNGLGSGDRVVLVAGTNPWDELITLENTGGAWGSSWGAQVDVGAPAIHITYLLAEAGYGTGGSGTSDAAPLVAGVAALVLARAPGLSAAEVRSILQSTADPYVNADRFAGMGRVNAARAVEAAAVAHAAGSHPVASIETLTTSIDENGFLRVFGTASSPAFLSARFRLGVGLDPGSWIVDLALPGPIEDGLIGSWDVAGWPMGVDVRMELEVHDSHGQVARDAIHPFELRDTLYEPPPWPLALPGPYERAVLSDLTGDGAEEILVLDSALVAWNGSGAPLPGWPIPVFDLYVHPPARVDVDGDTALETIVAYEVAAGSGIVHAYRGDGSEPVGWPHALAERPSWQACIGDVDGGGDEEIVLYSGVGTTNMVNVLRRDGTQASGWPTSVGTTPAQGPVLVDIDGDGDLEIFVRTYGDLRVLDGDGSLAPGWPVTPGASGIAVAGDLDGDGDDEIVRPRVSELTALDGDGTTIAGWPRDLGEIIEELLLADIDADGVPEIIVDGAGSTLFALRADGTDVAGFPVMPGFYLSVWMVVDVDGDPALEIVYTLTTDSLIHALEPDGSPSGPPWPLDPMERTVDWVGAGDPDGDGRLDILAQCRSDVGFESFWRLHRYDLGVELSPRGWRERFRDAKNARRLPPLPPVSVPVVVAGSGTLRLEPPLPNPSRGTTLVSWETPAAGPTTVSVIDVSGRRVRRLAEGWRPAGLHRAEWDGLDERQRRAAAGVYFIRLEAAGESISRRLVRLPR